MKSFRSARSIATFTATLSLAFAGACGGGSEMLSNSADTGGAGAADAGPNGRGDAVVGLDAASDDVGSGSDAAAAADGGAAFDGGAASDAAGGADAVPLGDGGPFTPAPHPTFPLLVAGPDGVMASPKLVTVVAQNETLAADLFQFADELIASSWWPAVSTEYGVGPISQSIHITGPAITTNPNGAEMEQYITNAIANHPEAQPNGSTIYMLYLPDGIDSVDETFMPPLTNTDCQLYGGYHQPLGMGPDNWAIGQRCTQGGSTMLQLDTLTETASHEIAEAATDPLDGYALNGTSDTMPWVDDVWAQFYGGSVENGDLCGETEIRLGRFIYQRIWSNRAARAGGDPCVPTIAEPYYSTSAPQGWYQVAPGATVRIPITGWSTGQMDDWMIEYNVDGGGDGFTIALTSPTMAMGMMGPVPTINNGRTAELAVTAGSTVQRGMSFVIVEIDSLLMNPGSDTLHFWPVGVYVP
jgi:hypothetical protein